MVQSYQDKKVSMKEERWEMTAHFGIYKKSSLVEQTTLWDETENVFESYP